MGPGWEAHIYAQLPLSSSSLGTWCIPQSVETPVRCGVLDSPCHVRRLWITVLLQVLHVQMFFLGGARSSVLDAVFRDGKRDVSSLYERLLFDVVSPSHFQLALSSFGVQFFKFAMPTQNDQQ